jgi:hypothetical protein
MRKRRVKRTHQSETGLLLMIRAVGFVTVLSAVLTVTTFWSDYDLSAQRIGAAIDRAVSQTESLAGAELPPGT